MSRLTEIVDILLDKRTVTASELAERFAVSQRTIYRDIDTLSLSGVPVYTNKGRGGGISLLSDSMPDRVMFEDEEHTEILSAAHTNVSNLVTERNTENVAKRIRDSFNDNEINWLDVDLSDWNYETGKNFQHFRTAILEQQIVEFDYNALHGEKTHRKIEPIQLLFKHNAWYVKGFCLDKKIVRLFRLMYVKNLMPTEEVFEEREQHKDIENSDSVTHIREEVTITLRISSKMSHRVYDEFEEQHIIKNRDESHTVTATYPEDEWLYGFIMSFGEHAEVIAPKHIRNIIKEKHMNSLRNFFSKIHWHQVKRSDKHDVDTQNEKNAKQDTDHELFSRLTELSNRREKSGREKRGRRKTSRGNYRLVLSQRRKVRRR